MLTDAQILEIIKFKELKCHHGGGHGHGDDGHGGSPEEPKKKKNEPKKNGGDHKDQNQEVSINYFKAAKPHRLPWVAKLIYLRIPDLSIENLLPCGVDENFQLYRLTEGAGIVPQHVDENFEGPNNSVALYSILVYLNDSYTGGQTVFNGMIPAPRAAVGGGLLFRHDTPHEGLAVLSGEKYVLKTDLLFRRR